MEQSVHPLRGPAFMVLATVMIATSTLFAKIAGTSEAPLHPLQVSHARFLFAALGVAVALLVLRPTFTQAHIKLHALRTGVGWLGVSLMFAAVAVIPLPDATAISFLNPIFAMLLAIVVLGERVGPWRWTGAAIALFGGVILLRPGGDGLHPGALLALGAAICFGIEITLIKRLSGREGALQILAINNGLGLLIATVAVSFVWQWPTAAQWPVLAGVGLSMVCAQACFIQAMKSGDASATVPLQYLVLVFAAIYDWAVFNLLPDAISYLGAAIILSGAGLVAWREVRARSGL